MYFLMKFDNSDAFKQYLELVDRIVLYYFRREILHQEIHVASSIGLQKG